MAFNIFVPPMYSPEQAGGNPNLFNNAISTYTQATEAKNLKSKLQEALTKQQLENKYYGREKENEFNLRNSQAREANERATYHGRDIMSQANLRGQQANYYGAQTRGENITNQELGKRLHEDYIKSQQYNKYYGPGQEADIDLKQAQRGETFERGRNLNITNQGLGSRLMQDLIKQQLENKYYAPKTEADIAYTKAGTGLIGQQERSQHFTNKELKDRLHADLVKQKLENSYYPGKAYADEQEVRARAKLLNEQANSAEHGNELWPEEKANKKAALAQQKIQDEIVQQHLTEYKNNPKKAIQDALANYDPNQLPVYSDLDLINEKVHGQDTFKKRYDSFIDAQTANMKSKAAQQYKTEAKKDYEDFKDINTAEKDLPVLQNALQTAQQIKQIVRDNPDMWGHNYGVDYYARTGQSYFGGKPNKLVGTVQTELLPIITGVERKLSNMGNQLALRMASSKLPYFNNSQDVAIGKMDGIINQIEKQIEYSQNLAGGNIERIGNDKYQEIDGEWHKVKR